MSAKRQKKGAPNHALNGISLCLTHILNCNFHIHIQILYMTCMYKEQMCEHKHTHCRDKQLVKAFNLNTYLQNRNPSQSDRVPFQNMKHHKIVAHSNS